MNTPYAPLLYSKNGAWRGLPIRHISAPKHRPWVHVRTASPRRLQTHPKSKFRATTRKAFRAIPELTIWGGWAAAFLFFYAWSGSTEFVFNAWWGFQNNLFYTWSVFPEGTRKYLCRGASFRPIVLDRNVN